MARSSSASSLSRTALAAATKLRCAIYTRKSSEEGLEQDFNSLDAQREACEAYILSQRHEGWTALPQMYDDGGISGGTMERPALKRLLVDVSSGKIDVVVVYKVDRLTRSLADFAKMVEIFDQRSVSFVSVTQAFNTTSSMGRLTLNVLLSFAQFEREVTSERIRDKIAASKKKGMWMGGLSPLGYDVQDRKLVVNAVEAKTVQLIFGRYAALKSVRLLQAELGRAGIVSKSRKRDNGSAYGGQPLGRGALYAMLANRLYRGEIVHKGVSHPGQHDPIIDEVLFNNVQQILADNRASRARGTNADAPSLLAGLIFDADGNRMTPTHASKKGVRYRYYVSQTLIAARSAKSDVGDEPKPVNAALTGQRLPAAGIERLVVDRLRTFFTTPSEVVAAADADDDLTNHRRASFDAVDQQALLDAAGRHASVLASGGEVARRDLLLAILQRVAIHPDRVDISIDRSALLQILNVRDAGVPADPTDREAANSNEAAWAPVGSGGEQIRRGGIKLTVPVAFRRAGHELRLIVPGRTDAAPPDQSLARILARASRLFDRLNSDPELTAAELARNEALNKSYVSRLVRLAFLAPDIVTAILDGRKPVTLTANKLMADTRLPIDWAEQRRALGFE